MDECKCENNCNCKPTVQITTNPKDIEDFWASQSSFEE